MVARWLEHWTVSREDQGLSQPLPFRNLGNFVHPTLPVPFGRDTKSCWSGEVKHPTQGNGKKLSWTHRANCLDLQKPLWALL